MQQTHRQCVFERSVSTPKCGCFIYPNMHGLESVLFIKENINLIHIPSAHTHHISFQLPWIFVPSPDRFLRYTYKRLPKSHADIHNYVEFSKCEYINCSGCGNFVFSFRNSFQVLYWPPITIKIKCIVYYRFWELSHKNSSNNLIDVSVDDLTNIFNM